MLKRRNASLRPALRWLSLGTAVLGLALWTAACGRGQVAALADTVTAGTDGSMAGMAAAPAPAPAKDAPVLKPVPKDEICMVQKYFMGGGKLTPVPLDGKTYWVCCEGCKNTITKDPSERWAVDPVSGRKVNKADAVLGLASNGQVHFFESEADRDAFRPTPTPPPDKD